MRVGTILHRGAYVAVHRQIHRAWPHTPAGCPSPTHGRSSAMSWAILGAIDGSPIDVDRDGGVEPIEPVVSIYRPYNVSQLWEW